LKPYPENRFVFGTALTVNPVRINSLVQVMILVKFEARAPHNGQTIITSTLALFDSLHRWLYLANLEMYGWTVKGEMPPITETLLDPLVKVLGLNLHIKCGA